MIQLLSRVLPQYLLDYARSNTTIRRMLGVEVSRIGTGVGKGLWFNTSPYGPAYASGGNELPVQESLAHYLKPGDVFYDIGASIGFFTIIAAKLVTPTGSVYAFEPVPENAAHIRLNIALNNFHNVTVIAKAVCNTTGQGELLVTSHPGGATLSTTTKPADVKYAITIDLVSIDNLVFQQHWVPPAVVKIDVEGAEIDVLQGMRRTLHEFKPILIYEIDDGKKEPFRRKQEICNDFLRGLGYQITPLENSYPNVDWIVGHNIATPGRDS
jgi:FkbM family methyltransferase